ncbi:13716_t:CDS:1, partial [Racocetra fulgida]
ISSIESASTLNPNLTKPFRQPLHKTVKPNLPLHINAMKKNPTIGGRQTIRKALREDNSYGNTPDNNFYDNTSGASIVKNYYITAEH